jgi:membrane-bound lytic murein transglycosylase B
MRRSDPLRLTTLLLGLVFAVDLGWAVEGVPAGVRPSFESWLAGLRREAQEQGVSPETLARALGQVRPIERVIELDRRQPEFTQTFWSYLDKRVTPERVARGRQLLEAHGALLRSVSARYGVQPHYLVAFWGLETNFGDVLGDFPVIDALATLAYDGRRDSFFRAQLLDALRILDAGHVSLGRMKGSWAGAMGQLQFIPSTFVRYAVDGDRDGRKDLWDTLPDVFASGANFLAGLGWNGDERWGREVRLPADFDWELAQLDLKKPLAAWSALGVRHASGAPLPQADMRAALVLPQGHAGPAFLVYDNFEAILGWNRSVNYAIAVGHLADRLIGLPPLSTGRGADNRPMSRDQTLELQQRLAALGYAVGEPDGVSGAQTRAAVRAYQRARGLKADGYPSVSLLEALRTADARTRERE